jgi:hypothetical protein
MRTFYEVSVVEEDIGGGGAAVVTAWGMCGRRPLWPLLSLRTRPIGLL